MKVSKDFPFYFLTSVCKDRLPVFRTETLKATIATAFDEARASGKFHLFAYVIMPDHYHVITDSSRSIADTLRFLNGVSAKRVIDHLKNNSLLPSLEKLRRISGSNRHSYSLWDHHPNAFRIEHEAVFRQKASYIHQNPVRAGLVESALDYRYSSARIWSRVADENEPLQVDLDKIEWRRS